MVLFVRISAFNFWLLTTAIITNIPGILQLQEQLHLVIQPTKTNPTTNTNTFSVEENTQIRTYTDTFLNGKNFFVFFFIFLLPEKMLS